ncbi:MAG: aminotransferase class I/II-fold pyridoxal phosphate-dependent enzyme, partial [Planctomycetales bacterium]|nr:aminotransferase class I/II-fold pyridoxal phosphate-dependent enzyme [Planctomycetales bacterium]
MSADARLDTSSPKPADATAAGQPRHLGQSTRSVHSGEARHKSSDAVTDAIVCSSTFTFENTQSIIDFIEHKQPREEYGRYGNPNEKVVEGKLAALDAGEEAIVYSSGMAAIVGLIMAKVNAGDEIVFFDQCYHRSREFCFKHLARFGVVTHQVPTGDFAAMEAAINSRTKILVSESPTNPHLTCIDLQRFVELGKKHEVETLIDATLATPCNLRPLEFGVDYVLHSATKYLGGHSDVVGGFVATSNAELAEPLRFLQNATGAVPSPFD